jgi:hypothetical protein
MKHKFTESLMVAAGGYGRNWVLVFYGHRFQFCKIKRVLEMDGDNGCTSL